MEIKFFGANAVRLQTKKAGVVIDDNLSSLGQKSITKESDLSVFTSKQAKSGIPKSAFYVDGPGEYEVMNISLQGIATQAHIDEAGKKNATMYRLAIDDFKVGVVGHIYPDIDDDQLERLGMIDVLLIPVGGNGYTLDAAGALKIIKKIGPSIVIPTHYKDSKIKYEVPQDSLEDARKVLSMEPAEELDSLTLKGREFAEGTRLVILKNSL
ncbi:MAG TPA: MBL fold metallo-hydrolase [Candidatus Saccharimonadales bacterium]|nr:MBL fold metallo-hydrolase [Candidatus Saccharimonadales bacterium]